MTQPPAPPTVPYYSPFSTPPPNPRPTSVTVLAIIGIILGGLGVLCTPVSIASYFTDFGIEDAEPAYTGTALAAHVVYDTVNWLLSLVLVICCIGALRLAQWGRTGMMAVSILWLVMIPIAIAMFVAWDMDDLAMDGGDGMEVVIGGIAGAACILVLGVLYPAFVLYYLTRPHVKQAFGIAKSEGQARYDSPYQPPGPG